jgi:hypothetical protein
MRWGPVFVCLLLLVTALIAAFAGCSSHGDPVAPLASRVQVLTQHNDDARTGANLSETTLTVANVASKDFGKLFEWTIDGQVYAQPLYVSDVSGRDLLIVATEHNDVYAFDARASGPSAAVWHVNLGPSFMVEAVTANVNTFPEMGITSTPVIDLATRTIYIVTLEDYPNVAIDASRPRDLRFHLHALDLDTGRDLRSVPIDPVRAFDPPDGIGLIDPRLYVQRAGLVLTRGRVLVTFASNLGDYGSYTGWAVRYRTDTLAEDGVIVTTPLARQGGIWQSGMAPAVNADGHVFLMTSNSDHADPSNTTNALVELSDAPLEVVSIFRGPDPVGKDLDLGSSGPVLVPQTPFVVGGGKPGVLYVAKQGDLGSPLQEVDLFAETGGIFGSPVYWAGPQGPRLYVWGGFGKLVALPIAAASLGPDLIDVAHRQLATLDVTPKSLGAYLSISADGNRAGTGILWANVTMGALSSTLVAIDASDIDMVLYRTDQAGQGITGGARMAVPTVAGGRVFVGSYEYYGSLDHPAYPNAYVPRGYVAVYGLGATPAPPPAATTGPAVPDASAPVDCLPLVTAPEATPPSWNDLYTRYFGPAATSQGRCATCHAIGPQSSAAAVAQFPFDSSSAEDVYTAFTTHPLAPYGATLVDLSDPASSLIADPVRSPLVWYGGAHGSMPPASTVQCDPAAIRDINQWLATGAADL